MLTFRFNGAYGEMTSEEILTSGMIGKEVKLEFSEEWTDLSKTVVFTAGKVSRDVIGAKDPIVSIPADVLAVPYRSLTVGVYGVSADGKTTPTIYAQGPTIYAGVNPSRDPGTDPDLPIWAQLQQQIDALEKAGFGGGIHITADEDGNVIMTASGSVSITDDGAGNVVIV